MSSLARLLSCFLLLAASASAAPEAGSYTGVLRFTQHILGIPTTTTVRVLATVSQDAKLTVVMATPPSLFPDDISKQMQTTIDTNGFCIIPRLPVVETPAVETSSTPQGDVLIGLPLPRLTPQYRGRVTANGSVFSLYYNDIPDRYFGPDGREVFVNHFVAPRPKVEFTFTFRRLNSTPVFTPQTGRAK